MEYWIIESAQRGTLRSFDFEDGRKRTPRFSVSGLRTDHERAKQIFNRAEVARTLGALRTDHKIKGLYALHHTSDGKFTREDL